MQDTADEICRRLALGESLRGICRMDGMPSMPIVMEWVGKDIDGFAKRYARAKEIGLELLAEELLEITDDASNDWMERNDPNNPGYTLNGEHVQRSRLRVDTRKWLLSKLVPKKYGDKLELAGKVEGGFALIVNPRNRKAA